MLVCEGEDLFKGGLGVVTTDGIALVDPKVDVLTEPRESNTAISTSQPTERVRSKSLGERWLTEARRILRTFGSASDCAGYTQIQQRGQLPAGWPTCPGMTRAGMGCWRLASAMSRRLATQEARPACGVIGGTPTLG